MPTSRALELGEPVKRVLHDIDGLLRPASFEPSTASFTILVAATDYAHRVIIVPFLSMFRRQAPGIRIAVWRIEEERVREQLERGGYRLGADDAGRGMPATYSTSTMSAPCVRAIRMRPTDRCRWIASASSTMRSSPTAATASGA